VNVPDTTIDDIETSPDMMTTDLWVLLKRICRCSKANGWECGIDISNDKDADTEKADTDRERGLEIAKADERMCVVCGNESLLCCR
jgi:hypothetical protein